MDDEMERGRFAAPVRVGSEVHRTAVGSSGVEALLRHFDSVGCQLTPRFLGQTEDGRERLSYVEGSTDYPPLSSAVRSEAALESVARAIRCVHDMTLGSSEASARGLTWTPNETAWPAVPDIIGHHDLAPWNIVFDGAKVVGIIDWDSAGPSTRVWDLAYAAYQFVPFHPGAGLEAFGWPAEPDRRERLALFVRSYGGNITARDIVDPAILRIVSMGSYIAEQVAKGNPLFRDHAAGDHATGYFSAAAELAGMRNRLI